MSLQGNFYIWPGKIYPGSFINYLKSFCPCPRLLLRKHCTNSALGKPFMVRRLQKVVLAGCRGCIWTYAEHIPAGSEHWGCKDVQGLTAVRQTTHRTLLLPKEGKFCGLAKVRWFRNMTVAPLELISAFSFSLLTSAHGLSLEFSVLASSPQSHVQGQKQCYRDTVDIPQTLPFIFSLFESGIKLQHNYTSY